MPAFPAATTRRSALRQIPAEKLVKTAYANDSMTVDGYAITEQPYLSYEKGRNHETALLQGFNEYSSAYFTGLNNGLVSGILAFTRTFLIQTVMILVLPLFLGTDGLWLAQAATELFAAVIAIAFFITRKREYCGS